MAAATFIKLSRLIESWPSVVLAELAAAVDSYKHVNVCSVKSHLILVVDVKDLCNAPWRDAQTVALLQQLVRFLQT
jgi:hypothetical protein